MDHKCQQLREQLKTIEEVSEDICDVLETDKVAAVFMEETYQFTDICKDLIATVSKKINKTTSDNTRKSVKHTVKAINPPPPGGRIRPPLGFSRITSSFITVST